MTLGNKLSIGLLVLALAATPSAWAQGRGGGGSRGGGGGWGGGGGGGGGRSGFSVGGSLRGFSAGYSSGGYRGGNFGSNNRGGYGGYGNYGGYGRGYGYGSGLGYGNGFYGNRYGYGSGYRGYGLGGYGSRYGYGGRGYGGNYGSGYSGTSGSYVTSYPAGGDLADPGYAMPTPTGQPIEIVNDATNGATLTYQLNEFTHSIQPGQTQKLTDDRPWVIVFDRGGGRGEAVYTLPPGRFKFVAKPQGWDLTRDMSSTATTMASKPDNAGIETRPQVIEVPPPTEVTPPAPEAQRVDPPASPN